MVEPGGEAPVEIDAHRVGIRPHAAVRRLTRATIALVSAGFAIMLVSSLVNGEPTHAPSSIELVAGFGFLASIVTAGAALLAQLACWIGPVFRGHLSLDASGVRVTGLRGRTIPRADIDAGWILHRADRALLELRLRNGNVFSALATPAAAAAALDAAGLDPAHRALRMPLGGALTTLGLALFTAPPVACLSATVLGMASTVIPIPSAALGFLIFAAFIGLVVAAVQRLSPPVVAVGRDGLSVGEGRRAWFVRFDDVDQFAERPNAITLRLRDGRFKHISTLGTSAGRRRALLERIAAGLASSREPLDLSSRLTALDRNGRSPAQWRDDLARLATPRDDYRASGLTRSEVEAALDDPRSTAERRIGAALALASMDAESAGARVRVVAETVAHEPVRVALTQAVEGELDEATLDAATRAQSGG